MTLANTFAGFFNLGQGIVNLYFPGLKKTRVGYELDFHRFADDLELVRPKLKIKRIGINHNKETVEARTDLDNALTGDLYDLEYDGILFLPRFTTWDREWKFNKVRSLSNLVENCTNGNGIFVYRVNEEIHPNRVGEFADRIRKSIDGDLIAITEGKDSHYFIKAT
ncbi:MAG: hypothetical protein Q8R00_02185 [Candidatus Nanoarchaeia archaeon]|nr:hypothetical protein [Candidatus Nanoarchaeia archaeon]